MATVSNIKEGFKCRKVMTNRRLQKESWRVWGVWSCKFYDQKDL